MKAQLLKTIHNSRQYTLSVAEALPEKDYSSVLVKGTWSFGELFNHIAYGIRWWESNFVKGTEMEWSPPAGKTSKKEVIGLISGAFDSLAKAVGECAANDRLITGVWATLDHITHHRGQALLHLRQHGVIPPEYVGISQEHSIIERSI